MKYEVLKDFKGSPDGRFAVDYQKGQTVELTDSLAEVALKEKWVKPAKSDEKKAKAEAEAKAKEEAEAQRQSAIKELLEAVVALERQLADAADADKPTIEKQLADKQAEITALQAD